MEVSRSNSRPVKSNGNWTRSLLSPGFCENVSHQRPKALIYFIFSATNPPINCIIFSFEIHKKLNLVFIGSVLDLLVFVERYHPNWAWGGRQQTRKIFGRLWGPSVLYIAHTRQILGCARFAEISCELAKSWSLGATECRVWIFNCNVKVWKSTEHKLHNIWRSVKF